jgi:hypothetical protein
LSIWLFHISDNGLSTLQRIEKSEGVVKGNFATVHKIQSALEQRGIHFIDDEAGDIGVRLQVDKHSVKHSPMSFGIGLVECAENAQLVFPIAASIASPSRSTIVSTCCSLTMNGGASSTWSPATPSTVPPIG